MMRDLEKLRIMYNALCILEITIRDQLRERRELKLYIKGLEDKLKNG